MDFIRYPNVKVLLALNLGHNFCSEVFLLLFDAFAQLEASKCQHFSVVSLQQLSNGLIRVLNELLVNQAYFLVVFVDAAQNHLFNDLFGFAFVTSLLGQNFLLVLQLSSRNLRTLQ